MKSSNVNFIDKATFDNRGKFTSSDSNIEIKTSLVDNLKTLNVAGIINVTLDSTIYNKGIVNVDSKAILMIKDSSKIFNKHIFNIKGQLLLKDKVNFRNDKELFIDTIGFLALENYALLLNNGVIRQKGEFLIQDKAKFENKNIIYNNN